MMNSGLTTLVVLLILFPIVLLGSTIIFKREMKKRQLKGVQWLQALRALLMHVQKHRGLCSAYLSGDYEVEQELTSLKSRISYDISAVSQLGDWIESQEDWTGITRHWAKLGAQSETIGFPKSFSQHCKLVANILTLLDTVAEYHKIGEVKAQGQSYALWNELLWVGELIGQSRALGVRLLGLPKQDNSREKYKKQIRNALEDVTSLLDHPLPKHRISAEEITQIHSFVEFVRHNLLNNIGLITPNEYFQQATQTISVIYECFDREIQKLYRKIAAQP